MALQSFWIAINDGAFTPTYLSVESNITSSAMSWSSLSPYFLTTIQYDGETWSVWEVTSNNSYYQVQTMETYKAWFHNENSSINRATYDAYTPQSISSTVDVYVLTDIDSNATQRYPDIGITTSGYMLFFRFNQTYVPGSSATNSWSQSGDTYSITVNQNNAWISTSKSVTANHNYSITIHVNSQSGYDGVIVTSATNSSSRTIANATSCSGYIKHASGSSTTVTTTYTPTSNGYIYLYFKTNASTISPDPEAADVTIVDNGIPAPEWVWSGNSCSISVADTSQWIGTTYSCSLNHSYSISVNVNAESGYDGVIISSSSLSRTAISNASSASGYITHASGDPASSTATFTAPSNSSKIYIYFISDISNITPNPETASVTITDMGMIIDVNVTLNKNSGSGGTSSVTITNGTVASNYPDITLPSRSGFTFLGYYDSQTGGTQYYTASGDGARIFDKTSDCTFYAHWQVNITDYYYSSASVYCSSSAGAATSSQGTRTVQIASASPSAGGGSVTTTIYSIDGSTSSSSLSGWSLSSDKKTLTIPSGKYAGSYTVRIKMEVSGNAPSYEGNTIYADVTVQLLAVIASSYSNPTVSHDTPITLDYAGETYTMDPSFSQTVYWTNDTSSTITSGASYSYSVVTSCTGFSLSSNKVTVTSNDGETVRGDFVVKITCTANGKSGTKNVTFDQEVGIYYDTPVVTRYEYVWFDASGETRAADYVEYQQVKHTGNTTTTLTSGGTPTFYSTGTLPSGFSLESNFSTTGRCTWSDMGSTQTSVEKHAEDHLYVKVSMNGKTSAAYYCDSCYQEPNDPEWADPVFSAPTNNSRVSLSAAGQTYTITPAATQIYKLASGYTLQTVTLSSSDFSYSVYTSKTGYSLSSNQVTVTNNTSTSARNGFRVKITASKNSKSSLRYQYFDQPAGSQGNLNPVITGYSYSNAGATGVTNSAPTVSYQQEQNAWNGVAGSGTVVSNTGGTLAFSTTGTLPSGFSTGTNFATTGNITWANNTTTSSRNAKSNLKVTVTIGSLTSSAYTCTACLQSAGAKVYGTPSVTFKYSTSVPASGAVDLAPSTLTCTQPYTWNGVSGSGGTETVTSSTTWAFTRNANGYTFIANGTNFATTGKINVASRGTTADSARDFYNAVLVTATVNGKSSTAAYASAGKQNANAVESLVLIVASTTINYNGNTTFTTTATYSSGETQDVTTDATYSDNPTGVVSINKSS